MNKRALFVAATAQNVGKTTACLGLMSGLQKRFSQVGFIKPVGQSLLSLEGGIKVDKDVALVRDRFSLAIDPQEMSPVVIPGGFTRGYLDGEVHHHEMVDRIKRSFRSIATSHEYTLVEGTGHVGVGSIIDLSNADVARHLDLEVVLISQGGLGNAFDQLAINRAMLEAAGVRVRAIIVNRVHQEKREMVVEYIQKALNRWNIPLAGCIPYNELLDSPSMRDFELLFDAPLISGEAHRFRHFRSIRLAATTVENYRAETAAKQLVITHASRRDVIEATIELEKGEHLERGMILAGSRPPHPELVDQLREASIPVIYAPLHSYEAMKRIANFTAKIGSGDVCKVQKAIDLMEHHIDFDKVLG